MTKTHCFSGKLSQTKEQRKFYNTFKNIQARCTKKNNKSYCNYGGRGIKCERNNFEEFRDDMRHSFLDHIDKHGSRDTTIDRIDNDGNYCKENCRWVTWEEQGRNRRYNRVYLVNGREYMAEDLSRELGISHGAAGARLKKFERGEMSEERLFSKEELKQERKKYYVEGERYDVYRLMKECDITLVTAENRLRHYQQGRYGLRTLLHKGKIRNKRDFIHKKVTQGHQTLRNEQ